jgi:hypothetical protein
VSLSSDIVIPEMQEYERTDHHGGELLCASDRSRYVKNLHREPAEKHAKGVKLHPALRRRSGFVQAGAGRCRSTC